MLWASSHQTQGCALWHIFPQAASSLICDYLRRHVGFSGPGHPIHSQCVYLTPGMLAALERLHEVRPFTIRQKPRQAIYIPAGCAYQVRDSISLMHMFSHRLWPLDISQVSHQTNAINITCDFMSIEHLSQTRRLCDEFRQHRLDTGVGEDVLRFYITMWHVWKSLATDMVFPGPALTLPDAMSTNSNTRKERKRASKREKQLTAQPPSAGV
jgi:hypothetical protein